MLEKLKNILMVVFEVFWRNSSQKKKVVNECNSHSFFETGKLGIFPQQTGV